MEQYTKGLDTNTESQNSVRSVVSLVDVSNGQTKIISTFSLEVNGGNSVQSVIDNMIEKSSARNQHGTKGTQAENLGTILRGLNQHGIVVLKPRKKSVVDIVGKNFTHQKSPLLSAQSRVRCIREMLIYLKENNLI